MQRKCNGYVVCAGTGELVEQLPMRADIWHAKMATTYLREAPRRDGLLFLRLLHLTHFINSNIFRLRCSCLVDDMADESGFKIKGAAAESAEVSCRTGCRECSFPYDLADGDIRPQQRLMRERQ